MRNYSDKEVKQLNGFKKIMAFIMSFVLILSLSTEIIFAANSDDKEYNVQTVETVINDSDYTKYKSDKNYEKATEEIKINAENCISDGIWVENNKSYTLTKDNFIEFSVDIPKDSAYNLALSLAPLDDITQEYKFSLKIDGEFPFSACDELTISALWEDEGEIRTLTNGDQVSPLQKHKEGFSVSEIKDSEGLELYPYEFMLSKGKHKIKIEAAAKDLAIDS